MRKRVAFRAPFLASVPVFGYFLSQKLTINLEIFLNKLADTPESVFYPHSKLDLRKIYPEFDVTVDRLVKEAGVCEQTDAFG